MDKKIRKAVRTFLIKDGKVLVIKYNLEKNKGYYDIPGGKIEDGESSIDAAKRELKEETGLTANALKFIGKCFIEYPDIIFDLDLYNVSEYTGNSGSFEENDSMWVNISDILNESKVLGTVKLLEYIKNENEFINKDIKISSNIICDENHNIEKINFYKVRQIESKDNKEVENVIRTCLIEFGGNHEGTAWTDPDLGRFSEIYNEEGKKYWVAENEEGKIIGGVGIGTINGLEGSICELQKMYCLKDARGTKVSHLLIEIALEYAKKYYNKCYLETLENMIAAQKFYEKYDFKRLEKPLLKSEHFACDVCYLKDL